MKNIYGWLSPNGKFIATEQYGHLKNLDSHKEFKFIKSLLREKYDELDKIEKECQERAEKEGSCHAEWHIYEMASDELKGDVYKVIYEYGYLRVALQNEFSIPVMYFEGTSKAVQNSYNTAKILAESYSAQPKFDVIKS